jgi:hypothetical protein
MKNTYTLLRATKRAFWEVNSATGEVRTIYRSNKQKDSYCLGKFMLTYMGLQSMARLKAKLKQQGQSYRVVYRLPIRGGYPTTYFGSTDGGVRKPNALVASIIRPPKCSSRKNVDCKFTWLHSHGKSSTHN